MIPTLPKEKKLKIQGYGELRPWSKRHKSNEALKQQKQGSVGKFKGPNSERVSGRCDKQKEEKRKKKGRSGIWSGLEDYGTKAQTRDKLLVSFGLGDDIQLPGPRNRLQTSDEEDLMQNGDMVSENGQLGKTAEKEKPMSD